MCEPVTITAGRARDMAMAVVCGLGYWLLRTPAELAAFEAACRRSPRPDAAVFVRLCDALPWVRTLWHDPLPRPPLEQAAKTAASIIAEAARSMVLVSMVVVLLFLLGVAPRMQRAP